MNISSLLNTDLGNFNDSSLILCDGRLSMYNAIYTFLKFTCPNGKKLKHISLIKTNNYFKTKDLASPGKIRLSGLISKNLLKIVIPDTRP